MKVLVIKLQQYQVYYVRTTLSGQFKGANSAYMARCYWPQQVQYVLIIALPQVRYGKK